MHATTRSTPKEAALLNMLDHLPVTSRRKIHLRRFNFSGYPVLFWLHGISRRGRRYSMQCDVLNDGSLEVSTRTVLDFREAQRIPKARRFPGQLHL